MRLHRGKHHPRHCGDCFYYGFHFVSLLCFVMKTKPPMKITGGRRLETISKNCVADSIYSRPPCLIIRRSLLFNVHSRRFDTRFPHLNIGSPDITSNYIGQIRQFLLNYLQSGKYTLYFVLCEGQIVHFCVCRIRTQERMIFLRIQLN